MVAKRELDGYLNGTDGRFYLRRSALELTPEGHATLTELVSQSERGTS
jgi:hypothetical protein